MCGEASFGAVTFATGIAAGMSFVFTVSSSCTSAPEEREEKPRNRAFGYVAKSDALSRQRRRRLPVAVPSRKKPSRRARPKSPRGVLAKEMIPGCEHKCERRLTGGGGEPRSGRKPSSGDRKKGQGPRGQKVRAGSDRTPCKRRAQGESKRKSRSAFGESLGHQTDGTAPPQRPLRDSRRPTCTRTAANLGVPLPQQVRCRGAHRATNARLAERAQA